jgi:hypothetical protein
VSEKKLPRLASTTSNREARSTETNSVRVSRSEERLCIGNVARTASHFPFPGATSATTTRNYGETEERILRCPNRESSRHLLQLGRSRRADQRWPGFFQVVVDNQLTIAQASPERSTRSLAHKKRPDRIWVWYKILSDPTATPRRRIPSRH